ncbi:MAG: serine protease [Polyangiaceae bacterium]
MRASRAAAALNVAMLASGCAVETDPTAHLSQPIVYGVDDREEYYQAPPAARSATAASMVALVLKSSVAALEQGSLPSLGVVDGLCPGEAFAGQPVAAFCTGVLVDWDLVLTAGHCASLFAIGDFEVAFGYYYSAPGVLAVQATDFRDPIEIVGWEMDPAGANPRLDYAWLRLSSPVGPPRQPAAIYVRPPPIELGEPLVSISTGGGVPMKIDEDPKVRDVRASSSDYFIADTDTSAGASGGSVFDDSGAVLGILARGGTDYVTTDAGCRATNEVPDGAAAQEQYTYAYRAVQGLCSDRPSASSICRNDCENPCQALAEGDPAGRSAAGCALAMGHRDDATLSLFALLSVLVALKRADGGRRCEPQRRAASSLAAKAGTVPARLR